MEQKVNVVIMGRLRALSLERVAAISPRIRIIDARNKFNQEMRETWPAATIDRYSSAPNRPPSQAQSEAERRQAQQERDEILAQADVLMVGFPYPLNILPRAPRLKWVHHIAASPANLRFGDLYRTGKVVITTSRGYNETRPIAEYVIAHIMAFAKQLSLSFADRQKGLLNRQDYHSMLLRGKTVGIVGMGGIGREVATLSKALGMRVFATRRSAKVRVDNIDGVDTLYPPRELNTMLAQSDFIAVCAQYTPETTGLIGETQLHALKPGAYLINISRGELIDEDALIKALSEKRFAGAVLDVYTGEFERPPRPDLLGLPNVIITPHVSGLEDVQLPDVAELFYENLKRFTERHELINVVDWDRGY